MKTETGKTVTKSKQATIDVSGALETVRQEIISASLKREQVVHQPVNQAEALARLSAWVQGLVDLHTQRVTPERFTTPQYRPPLPGDGFDLVLISAAKAMEAQMATRISEFYGKHDGFTGAERAEWLAKCDQEIFALSLAEEAIIRSAEAAGLTILRRADADPRAVLASNEVLP